MRRLILLLLLAALGAGCTSSPQNVATTPVTLQELLLSPGRLQLPGGVERSLTARGLYSDGQVKDLTDQVQWSSSQPGVASVDADGRLRAQTAGQTQVQATLEDLSADAEVQVTGAQLRQLEVTPGHARVASGLSLQLTARGLFSDGTVHDLTDQVQWTGPVSSTGRLTAGNPGALQVEASLHGVTGLAHIEVTSAVLESLQVKGGTLALGRSLELQATGLFSDQTQLDLTDQVSWTSLTPDVVSLSANRATGLQVGDATVQASLTGITGQAAVTVTAARLVSLEITPLEPLLGPDSSLQLTATGVFSDGTRQVLTDTVWWRSDSNTLRIAEGLARAGSGLGTVRLEAQDGSVTQAVTARVESLQSIQHLVVIFAENRSFDHLYGLAPGVNGISQAGATTMQTDLMGIVFSLLPPPLLGSMADPRFPANLPNAPYSLQPFVPNTEPADESTGVPVHLFYQEQYQINGGLMNRFVAWGGQDSSGAPMPNGLVMGNYSETGLALEPIAQQFVICDNFFHSAFGGSMLNHQWLVAAKSPVFQPSPQDPPPPPEIVSQLDSQGMLVGNFGAPCTPDGFVVNTDFSTQLPPPGFPAAYLVPPQTALCIGDLLVQAGVDFAYYSEGWNDAVAGKPDKGFQFHHQPFAYFANFAPTSPNGKAHLLDLDNFVQTLVQQTPLKPVSFVKFEAPLNEHPGEADVASSEQAVADLVQGLMAHPDWPNTVIVITYDENGGWWDHVAPPVVDRWGPGSRVPAIVIAPFSKKAYVDSTRFETASILKLIETRWGLGSVATRDGESDNLLHTLDL